MFHNRKSFRCIGAVTLRALAQFVASGFYEAGLYHLFSFFIKWSSLICIKIKTILSTLLFKMQTSDERNYPIPVELY
jgi:hypothetical protein